MNSGKNMIASYPISLSPCSDRILGPMGATGIGRHGAKNRSSLNGQSNAMPNPPSVRHR